MATRQISLSQARRIALGAQGFNTPRPSGRVDQRHLRRVLDHLGLIQIDSVNVLVRSQELPLFARLGAHPRNLIPRATERGDLFEYWVHEASHVRADDHRLYRWMMANPRPPLARARDDLGSRRPGFIDEVRRIVADTGPLLASDLGQRDRPKGTWWDWDDGKLALELLFHAGEISAVRRPNDFARLYDLTERVVPSDALNQPTPTQADARKELLMRAASFYGIATDKDLADYHRQKVTDCRPLLSELVEDGRLETATVEGWPETAFMHPDASTPRSIGARALLSPFDPVCWFRPRAERLWDFHYRIEIYTPAHKRRYGYYVLPFLLGDRLVGRVDLKADRARSALLVQAAWIEDGEDPSEVGPALADELELLADWLELDAIEFTGRGNLAVAR